MDAFKGLVAIVQYRRNDPSVYDPWHNMAAFDVKSVAEVYAAKCAEGERPWEYRVVDASVSND